MTRSGLSVFTLLTALLLSSAALACSVPVGFDPKCPTGESFNTISCRCAPAAAAGVAPTIRQGPAEERTTNDAARNKAENRILPAAPPRLGLLTKAMVRCAADQDCQVVGGVCGNPLAVNRAAVSDVAEIMAELNRRIDCARGAPPEVAGTAACQNNVCALAFPPAPSAKP